ncbi:uncharacterized protein LOC100643791 isoform X1 [Bombus terrestris]|uniref:Uncharacterized protein LOC100643791 isoform X1 n=2 Tax=Bombus terrestris TaxID=30195 RepID=A0A9B2JZI4_BOMTE|nr:uncharacterized protein LOC100643791 isoform X1 [Bombus terrestris]
MLHSKATAALLRLKEIDKKYNIKRNEGTRVQSNVSTESCLESSSRSLQVKSKTLNDKEDSSALSTPNAETEFRSKAFSKSKMEIKIPFNNIKDDESSISDSVTLNKPSKTSPKTRSIIESIEIEEESKDSRLKEFPESLSNLDTNSKDKVKIPTIGSRDSSRNNDNSSIATAFSRRSDVSETISEAVKSANETSSKKSDEKSYEPEMTMAEDNVPLSNSDNKETTIEEVIRLIEEKSEITSEQSNTMNKDISMEKISFKEEQKTRYEDDTFEEASSSIESTSSVEQKLEKSSVEDTVISGVKHIKITPHRQTENVQKTVIDEDRDKEIVELIAPKIMHSTSECDIGLDEELSNYVKRTENMDEAGPINLLKLPKQVTPTRRHVRRKKYRKLPNENTEEKTDSTSEHERLTEHKENSQESMTSIKSEKNPKETSLPTEYGRGEFINRIETGKSRTEIEDGSSKTNFSEEKLLRETPKQSDVTCTLRKLNKDAINAIVRRSRVQTPVEALSSLNKPRPCKNCGTIAKLPAVDAVDYDSDSSSLEKFKTGKETNCDQRVKQKKTKCKKVSRSSKNRKSPNCNKVEGKHSRFECRQMHNLRKHAAILRLQQEREDIRNYLLELEGTRLEFGPGMTSSKLSVFKPLEFPKIAAFVKPDEEDSIFKAKGGLAELQKRILTIKQCLKDQYILYRDYSSLAQTVNSKYIPASLEDAKRTIRQLQRATIKSR